MRAAVVGLGNIAQYHLAAIREHADVVLAGVCDLSAGVAEATAERYGAQRWYTDHKAMLSAAGPDVVHVTTPPQAHVPVALDALDAGAHVLLEKPAATNYEDVVTLIERARQRQRDLIEDYTYLFSPSILELLSLLASGDGGEVLHVEVSMCVDVLGPGATFADPAYGSHGLPGGGITDFLPHLASLAHAFVGPHRAVATTRAKHDGASVLPSDEFRALVDSERGTASLAFSANSRPDGAWVRVYTTEMRATARLFEPRLTVERVRSVPRQLLGVVNGLAEARAVARAAVGTAFGKVSGSVSGYDGLTELVRRTYAAVATGGKPPVSGEQVREVNRLVFDLVDGANTL